MLSVFTPCPRGSKAPLFRVFPFLLFFIVTLGGCGSVAVATVDAEPSSGESATPPETAASRVYLFATDYQSGGQIYSSSLSNGEIAVANSELTYLGSDAVIRIFDDKLYVLNAGFSTVSSDNLQIVDPAQNFATLGQHSTGNGTNPHDVVIVGENAFISLYDPEADETNRDADDNPGDVIEMETTTGAILYRHSFRDFLADDGEASANADQMALSGDTLYVALQDLNWQSGVAADSNGLIGIIDVAAHEIPGVIALEGRNPVGLALSDDGTSLAVANSVLYNAEAGDYDLSEPYGGLEIVDLETRATRLFLNDEDLGGYVERVESDSHNFYAVVSDFDAVSFEFSSRLVVIPHEADGIEDVDTLYDGGDDIREIALHNGYLWISHMAKNSEDGFGEPLLDVVDLFSFSSASAELPIPAMSLVAAE